ncbi:MAG TPA: hypothetical protein VFU71_20275 [Burkholderiaceae bacterium]|nr:hypothetical protein [Burkholderiaceae bacterium]
MPIESPFPTSPSTPSDPQATERRDTPMMSSSNDADLQHDVQRGVDATRGGAAYADDLIGRIAQGAHQAIDRLAEGAVPRLQESMASAGESLHARTDRAREAADEWTESLRCTVRENPLASLGVALAVGLLLARLAR